MSDSISLKYWIKSSDNYFAVILFRAAKYLRYFNGPSIPWLYRFISEGYDPRDDDHYVTKDSDTRYNMAGYFPEATRNYLVGLTLGF